MSSNNDEDIDIYSQDRKSGAKWSDVAFLCQIKNCDEIVHGSAHPEDQEGVNFQVLENIRKFSLWKLRSYWRRKTFDIINKIHDFNICKLHYDGFLLFHNMNVTHSYPFMNRFKHKCIIPSCQVWFKYAIFRHSVSICREHYHSEIKARYKFKQSVFFDILDELFTKGEYNDLIEKLNENAG